MGNQVCCATNCNQMQVLDSSSSPKQRAHNKKSQGKEMFLITQNAYDLQIEMLEEGADDNEHSSLKPLSKNKRPKTPEAKYQGDEEEFTLGLLEKAKVKIQEPTET